MIKQNLILLGKEPICTTSPRISRRSNINELPSHDPYIPRNNTLLFNCTIECKIIKSRSMPELVSNDINLKACYVQGPDDSPRFECESIRYHNLKNADKLLFLSKTMRDKSFYTVDCLIYEGGDRVCHKRDNVNIVHSHANLVDTGTLVRPKEPSVLAQDEFICEESKNKEINCDLNPYVPFTNGLKLKESMQFGDNVLLKSGTYVVILNRKCLGSWCGYSGNPTPSRRQNRYTVPGDTVYRCYYAKKQQVCKAWYSIHEKAVYNDRGYLTSA